METHPYYFNTTYWLASRPGFTDSDSSVRATVAGWNERAITAGTSFNYTELCPLTIGMVIRAVTQTSLSSFAAEALWAPMGAEASASWLTDSVRQIPTI